MSDDIELDPEDSLAEEGVQPVSNKDDPYFIPVPTQKLKEEDESVLLDDILKTLQVRHIDLTPGEHTETVKCLHPEHPDKNPSLEVRWRVGPLQASIHLRCFPCIHSGRKMSEIYHQVGVDRSYSKSDSYVYRGKIGTILAKKVVPRSYDQASNEQIKKQKPYWLYPDIDSQGTVRYYGKEKWREKNKGQWLPEPELYQLDEVYAHGINSPGGVVFIPEGEKDVETLRSQGYVATCEPHGAGSWKPDYAKYLAEYALAVILVDHDSPGIRRKDRVARSLLQVGKPVKCLQFEGPKGYDVTDWFHDGHTQQELDDLVKKAELISLSELASESAVYGQVEIPPSEKSLLESLSQKYMYLTQHGESKLTQVVFDEVAGFSTSTTTPNALKAALYAGHEVYLHTQDKKGNSKVTAINVIDYWNQPHKYAHAYGPKVYTRINFDPRPTPEPNIYNTWTGLKLEPIYDADLSEYLEFLKSKICGGDLEAYEFFLDFFAHLFQSPHQLSMVALVLRGKPGSGKSGIIYLMRLILGIYGIVVDKWDKVIGGFNSHLANKLLIAIDDATWGGFKKDVGALKNLITSTTLVIDGKYVPIIVFNNYARVVIVGNEEWIVDKDADDRRFFVIDVPEASESEFYYKQFFEKWKTGDHLAQVLGYLLRRNLANWSPIDIVRRRITGCEMGIHKRTPIESFIFHLAQTGSLYYPSRLVFESKAGKPIHQSDFEEMRAKAWPPSINMTEISKSANDWCAEHRLPIELDEKLFAKRFYNMLDIKKDKSKSPGTHWRSNSVITLYPRPLDETRALLLAKYKLPSDYFESMDFDHEDAVSDLARQIEKMTPGG